MDLSWSVFAVSQLRFPNHDMINKKLVKVVWADPARPRTAPLELMLYPDKTGSVVDLFKQAKHFEEPEKVRFVSFLSSGRNKGRHFVNSMILTPPSNVDVLLPCPSQGFCYKTHVSARLSCCRLLEVKEGCIVHVVPDVTPVSALAWLPGHYYLLDRVADEDVTLNEDTEALVPCAHAQGV